AGYATAIAALFGVSALYHRPTWSPRARAVMRRLDHSTIYVAIAATYTPIGAFVLPTASARLILGVVWGGAMAGIALRFAWSSAPAPVVALPYVALGWAAVLVMGDVWASMPRPGAVLLMVGGGLYTLGALIYALRRPDPWPRWFGYHEIFHVLVIGGAATHYVAVAYFALPR
ncbi:MAG: hemolysin III family protein, partial [Acidimicrobiia bacterium]|nr:hemolysin III family protein [Acidimicrobiia bacterium]